MHIIMEEAFISFSIYDDYDLPLENIKIRIIDFAETHPPEFSPLMNKKIKAIIGNPLKYSIDIIAEEANPIVFGGKLNHQWINVTDKNWIKIDHFLGIL